MALNPTTEVNLSFSDFVAERTMKEAKHLKGGIPDYAYASDYSLRQKLHSIPGFYAFFKAVMQTYLAKERQLLNVNALRVTNNQYPMLYDIAHHCASMLGIGVPTLYVSNDGTYQINAAAYAFEDSDPLIYVTSTAVDRLNEKDLTAMIGHECGHIQNNHVIYNTAVNYMVAIASGGLTAKLQSLLTQPIQAALYAWSRAAEVTADRAGCICCGDRDASLTFTAKLLDNASMRNGEYNVDEILKQYDEIGSYAQFQELMGANHPVAVRRILAEREFFDSEVYYSWHPEQKEPGKRYYSKEELDARCDKFVSTLKKGER